MPKHQLFMGTAVALLSAVAVWQGAWLVERTPKGQWLGRRLGTRRAVWLVRGLFATAVVFGVLLAADVIRPVQW